MRIVSREAGVDEETTEKLVKAANRIRNLVDKEFKRAYPPANWFIPGELLRNGLPMKDSLQATMMEPLTYDMQSVKKSIEEVLKNYFSF